jgi:propionyl-CoA carboxylase alpha chain
MATALDSYVIQGVTHNIPLLREVVGHAAFRSGRYSTKLLPEAFPKGFQGHALAKAESDALAAIASHVHWAQEARAFAANNSAMGAADEPAVVSIGGIRRQSVKGAEGYAIDGGHVQCEIDWALDSPLIQATIDGRRVTAQYLGESAGTLRLAFLGTHYAVQLQSQREAELARHMLARPKPDLSRLVRAPMPGQIVSVAVRPGDLVEPGAELLVMEAMKMQNVIRASKAGKVAKVAVSAGQSVAAEQDLLLLGDIE